MSVTQSGLQIKGPDPGINLRQSDLHFMLMSGRWLDQGFQTFGISFPVTTQYCTATDR